MAEIRLRPYRSGDEDAFTPRHDFAEERRAIAWTPAAGGRAWTLTRASGEVLGMGGVVPDEGGWLDAWACLADLPRRDWPRAIDLASKALEFALSAYRPRNGIIATARADNAGARLVLLKLSFTFDNLIEDPRAPGVVYVRMIRQSLGGR